MAAKKGAKAAPKRTTKSRPVAKKATKRTTVKKAAKPAAKVLSSSKIAVGDKPFTKSQFVSTIAEQTGLARKDVSSVLGVISEIIAAHIKKRGPASFAWPGIMKMKVINKPATKARQGTNPFTGETMMFKAKPASRKVKILPLKQLKEMASS
ncbi:MAG: HU family DNA-binding protein [Pseudomonadota bacterium]